MPKYTMIETRCRHLDVETDDRETAVMLFLERYGCLPEKIWDTCITSEDHKTNRNTQYVVDTLCTVCGRPIVGEPARYSPQEQAWKHKRCEGH